MSCGLLLESLKSTNVTQKYVVPKGHTQHKGHNSTTQRLGGSVESTPALGSSPIDTEVEQNSSLDDTEDA
ncbi:8986_t:CDS:2 [Paraglomus occultum]|uniref:8986_t:CDS:1 n=1 Tax=Paraglomus occultum TaxID=144539 RepID=A0A9N9EX61_9GLOM|nr:8986_t:CDS:2 [Paraglomus occultum]